MPEERDLNDYILVFPADSGIKPIYVYLKTARDEPGVATGKGETLSGSEKWLEAASTGLGAPVPSQIADKLRGQEFSNFDAFRAAFWKAVAADPELSLQFKPSNLDRMQSLNVTLLEQHVPGELRYAIDAELRGIGLVRYGTEFMPEGKVLIRHLKQQQHLENHQFI